MGGRKKFILSVDGGGVRGLIPLRILETLQNRMRQRGKNGPLYRYFDLMCGSSTGGLIAAGLAAPSPDGDPVAAATTVADLRRFFEDEAREVFTRDLGSRFSRLLTNPMGLFDEKYDARPFEYKLKDRFGWTSLHSARTNIVLTAYDIANRQAMFLTNGRQRDGETSDDFYFWQAVRATTAAPTYFEPAQAENLTSGKTHTLIDGGVFANDPVMAAYVEARKLGWSAEDIVIVSLGTGAKMERGYPFSEAAGWGALGWISPAQGSPILSILFHGQATTAAYQARWMFEEGRQCEYVRFDGEIPASAEAFDNARPGNIMDLNAVADRVIRDNTVALDRLADRLSDRDTDLRVPA